MELECCMLVILDYGMGNPGSVLNMLKKAGGEAIVTKDQEVIEHASGIILPGVGAFDNGMSKLNSTGMLGLLEKKVIKEQTPFLGVCLGMQLLFQQSEEGVMPGLGWIPGKVTKFNFENTPNTENLKIPHMGWNLVYPNKTSNLFSELEDESRFYFVHSYHANCDHEADVLASSFYGYEFTCAVQKENIFGAQFHPEKSHRFGLAMFKNFLKLI